MHPFTKKNISIGISGTPAPLGSHIAFPSLASVRTVLWNPCYPVSISCQLFHYKNMRKCRITPPPAPSIRSGDVWGQMNCCPHDGECSLRPPYTSGRVENLVELEHCDGHPSPTAEDNKRSFRTLKTRKMIDKKQHWNPDCHLSTTVYC